MLLEVRCRGRNDDGVKGEGPIMDVCGVWIELLGVVCMLDFGLVIVLSLGVRGFGVCLFWVLGMGIIGCSWGKYISIRKHDSIIGTSFSYVEVSKCPKSHWTAWTKISSTSR